MSNRDRLQGNRPASGAGNPVLVPDESRDQSTTNVPEAEQAHPKGRTHAYLQLIRQGSVSGPGWPIAMAWWTERAWLRS